MVNVRYFIDSVEIDYGDLPKEYITYLKRVGVNKLIESISWICAVRNVDKPVYIGIAMNSSYKNERKVYLGRIKIYSTVIFNTLSPITNSMLIKIIDSIKVSFEVGHRYFFEKER